MEQTNAKTHRAFIPTSLRPDLHAGDEDAATAMGVCATTAEIAQTAEQVLAEAGLSINRRRWDPVQFLDHRLVGGQDVQCAVLDDEAVLLNLQNGHYYTLNRVGTAMWELLGGRTLREVLDEICQRFEVDRERAHDDLVALVMRLESEGLVQEERG